MTQVSQDSVHFISMQICVLNMELVLKTRVPKRLYI